jgi:O-antigen ligase
MRGARGGWRSERSMALPGWASAPVAAPPVATAAQPVVVIPPPASTRAPALKWPWQGVEWSAMYVAFLGFVFVVTTHRIPLGAPLMLIAIIALAMQRGKLRAPRWILLFGAFLLWCAVGLAHSRYSDVTLVALTELAKVWIISLVAVNALRTRAQIRFFVVFYLACFAAYPVRGALLGYFFHGATYLGRAIWIHDYENPNTLAALALLQLALALTVVAGRYDHRIAKPGAAIGLFALSFLILLTQSRAAFIALVIATFFTLLGQRRRARSLLITLAIAVVALVSMPEGALKRVKGLRNATSTDWNTLMTVDEEGSANQRWLIWVIAGGVIRNHLFAGSGLGSYPFAHGDESRWAKYKGGRGRRDPHSSYVNVLAETGIPGMLLFLAMIMTNVIEGLRVRLRARFVLPTAAAEIRYLQMGLLAFAITAIWGTFDRLTHFYFFLALMSCLTMVTKEELGALARGARPAP